MDNEEYGCTFCGHVGQGFYLDDDNRKCCVECDGHMLNLQEAMDKILEQKSAIELLEARLEDDYDETDWGDEPPSDWNE